MALWLRGQDSNLRPSGYGPDELPTAPLRYIYKLFNLLFLPKDIICYSLYVILHSLFAEQTREMYSLVCAPGAGNRNRTGTALLPRDFKSLVSTNSTTPACKHQKKRGWSADEFRGLPARPCEAGVEASSFKHGGAPLVNKRPHKRKSNHDCEVFGAGDGNRTRVSSLGSWRSTIELHRQIRSR